MHRLPGIHPLSGMRYSHGILSIAGRMIFEGLGIAKHAIKKDLLFFSFPCVTAMTVELVVCGVDGERLNGFWQSGWVLISHPRYFLLFPLQRTVGILIFALGLTLMIVGQVTLWQNYSGFVVIKKEHQLVKHGIYRVSRNPIYLGAMSILAQ
jgi:hypothetical protein